MKEIVILQGARTPFGRFGGGLKDVPAIQLGVTAVKEALLRSQVEAAQVDHIVMGNVVQSGPDPIYLARHVGIYSGMPIESPALTVNRLCGSGLEAVVQAAHLIQMDEAEIVVSGGTENMSQIPYVMPQARWGYRMGNSQVLDLMTTSLIDGYTGQGMAITAENLAEKYEISREAQDQFSVRSQQLAGQAQQSGRLAKEIVPVALNDKKQTVIEHDEHMRPETTLEQLAKLKPAFKAGGSVTAGNASGINDGAAAVIVTSADKAAQMGVKPLARIKSWASAGVPPEIMGFGPVPASRKALERAGLTIDQMDIVEINEAFAAQYLAVEKALELNRDKVNVNGGAIAIGHPLGASGARVLLSAMLELQARQQRYALVSLCIGGGQGIAMVIENAAL
ncbi:acetyl-CoA C-acyltransferase [bacterium (Candidatus Blackallbacteria) CG17_big_fil_post_rev_8_21_14_2_50_48_46]|uniref:Acetyl-CoA C-acyltransferase n=1 Tax=bacterium (Candidatus Blackallbacteria) CG17_big_fil_post_rev_8_21_14_2_50_48_46 TaxID=2014261 RepID=A0A2M7G9X0_9BACT|nr:MAG: acetyl-CoA C-acyltransferase [bacterium (Candidatus Blackallbacteria) CG18_big_fil_WC_8_21_14_2_50_49_26]PIW18942.1 MAG: acetyl-CoA C-acyltransferase [bacterium (Candidatus Blackallbacteria) CG17_big_fil_post_rev_8_21_14_2_50_48_46]PIW44690.1 MAG: acetyl-CoA C-acyltransferase [bacterium (Candidatus Blackallbacteria) CG13_big_fil_rev_8_21_14_2_50_49_14]